VVKSVWVDDIFGTESSSFNISVFYDMIILCVLVLCTQVNMIFVMSLW
jgi:hypothetical protein